MAHESHDFRSDGHCKHCMAHQSWPLADQACAMRPRRRSPPAELQDPSDVRELLEYIDKRHCSECRSRDHTRRRVLSILGTRIRHRRKSLQMSQSQLARACRLTSETICHIELADRTPSMVSIQRIAKALRMPVDELVDGIAG